MHCADLQNHKSSTTKCCNMDLITTADCIKLYLYFFNFYHLKCIHFLFLFFIYLPTLCSIELHQMEKNTQNLSKQDWGPISPSSRISLQMLSLISGNSGKFESLRNLTKSIEPWKILRNLKEPHTELQGTLKNSWNLRNLNLRNSKEPKGIFRNHKNY